jgi:hypothetical protein
MAHDLIIKAVQNQEFCKEIHNLRKHGGVCSYSLGRFVNPVINHLRYVDIFVMARYTPEIL